MGFIASFVFLLIIILGVIIFLKFDKRMPLLNRLFFSIIGVLILIFLFFFISALVIFAIVIILVLVIFALFNSRRYNIFRRRKRQPKAI